MVVSRDWAEISVLECILGGLQINVEVEPELTRARAKLAKSKIDALIVDCDLEGSTGFLHGLERGLNTVPLVLFSSRNRRKRLQDDTAFFFQKPISVEQAVHTLSAARNQILDGRLRYHRHTVDLPAWVRCGSKRTAVSLLNLSQGGVAVRPHRPADLKGKVRLEFKLPGSRLSWKVDGDVVWNREGNHGIRFAEMTPRTRQGLQLWLAQQYLTQ
jgi:PilZ domain